MSRSGARTEVRLGGGRAGAAVHSSEAPATHLGAARGRAQTAGDCVLTCCPPLPCTPAGAATAALASTDKAHTIRQLGVGTPANHLLGLLSEGDARRAASKERTPKQAQ